MRKKFVSKRKHGSVMLATLILSVICVFAAAILLNLSMHNLNLSNKYIGHTKAFYATDLSTNVYYSALVNLFRGKGTITDADRAIERSRIDAFFASGSTALADGTTVQPIPELQVFGHTLSERRTSAVDETVTLTFGPYKGLISINNDFEIMATATYQGQGAGIGGVATTRQNVQLGMIPLFQFGLFYDQDWDLHPGPNMVFNGRVHSNGDIYLEEGAGLTFRNDAGPAITCSGSIYLRGKDTRHNYPKSITLQRGGWSVSVNQSDTNSSPGDHEYMWNNGGTGDVPDTGANGYCSKIISLDNKFIFNPGGPNETYMMQSVLNGVEPLLPPVLQTPIDYITDGTITDLQNQPALRYYKYCFKAPLVIRDGVAYYKTDVGGELHLSQSEPYPDPTQPVGPNNRIYHDLRWQDDTGIWHFPIKSYTLVQNQNDLDFYGGTLDDSSLAQGTVNFPDGVNNTAPTNLTTNPEGYEYIELGSVTGNDISTNINDYSHATNPDLIEQVQNAYTASHFDPGDDVIGAGDNLCIYSWRERSCYVFTEIDMGELTQECLNDNNIPAMSFGNMLDVPFGLSSTTLENIIYAVNSSVNASGDRCGAIRIKNASSLPWRISVSSPNPIYVWGNYNSSNKRPAGLYCDAINHLSVNWNDNNSTVTGNGPAAAQTTMNAALLYGVNETIAPQFWPNYNDGNAAIQTAMAYRKSATTPVPAQDENSVNMTPAQLVILESGGSISVVGGNIRVTNFYGYNLSNYVNFQDHFWYQDGGFENFMRYSENWSGIQEFLMGSFICLWEPQQGVGFKHNQRYSPPTRRWSFDTDFLIMGNLPPGTPFTVHFEKTVWGRKID